VPVIKLMTMGSVDSSESFEPNTEFLAERAKDSESNGYERGTAVDTLHYS
jgi:hypothetical protein